jgi:hypothetical protein
MPTPSVVMSGIVIRSDGSELRSEVYSEQWTVREFPRRWRALLLLPISSVGVLGQASPVSEQWFLAWRCHETQTPSDRLGRSFCWLPSCACFALARGCGGVFY